jgi:protein ImuB
VGPDLLQRLDQARGDQPDAALWLRLPRRFDTRLELQARADTTEQVLAGARILLQRLVAWAAARQVGIQRFTLVMHHEPRHRVEATTPARTPLAIAPAQPETDADHLHILLAERLGRLPLAAPALELSLSCDAVVAAAPPSGELFASRRSQNEGVGRLVERLQARLGQEQVYRLEAVADHRPEHATVWHAAEAGAWTGREGKVATATAAGGGAAAGTGPGAAASAATQGIRADHARHPGLPPQPIWLLPEPRRLSEQLPGPSLDGRPLRLLAGPERLETGWWDGDAAQRDYFIAQSADGPLVWIFRTRPTVADGVPGWYLHGLFG